MISVRLHHSLNSTLDHKKKITQQPPTPTNLKSFSAREGVQKRETHAKLVSLLAWILRTESVIWCGSTFIGEVVGQYRDGDNYSYRLVVGYNDPIVAHTQEMADMFAMLERFVAILVPRAPVPAPTSAQPPADPLFLLELVSNMARSFQQ